MPPLRHHHLTPAGPTFIELTCAVDGLSHRVEEAVYAAELARRPGRCRAACGHRLQRR
jgi:hypothetical protein